MTIHTCPGYCRIADFVSWCAGEYLDYCHASVEAGEYENEDYCEDAEAASLAWGGEDSAVEPENGEFEDADCETVLD